MIALLGLAAPALTLAAIAAIGWANRLRNRLDVDGAA